MASAAGSSDVIAGVPAPTAPMQVFRWTGVAQAQIARTRRIESAAGGA